MAVEGRAPSGTAVPNGIPREGEELARERVAEIQRTRILSAMAAVASEHGIGYATVAHVVSRAGVSRRTFYELFEDREDCFLAVFDEAVARASRHASDVYDPQMAWSERVRSVLTAQLQLLDAERWVGRLLVVESLGAGPRVMERRSLVLAQMAAIVDEGRCEGKRSAAPPSLTAEGIVGAILSILHTRIVEGASSLVELRNPLMSMIVLPYLGSAASRAELKAPISIVRPYERLGASDPLEGLGMRLTYRTIRVLLAVGAGPGASNREVGESSGAEDQGQISKLLARLEGLGLIHNDGTSGPPNAWRLTVRGRDVERAMNGHTAIRERR